MAPVAAKQLEGRSDRDIGDAFTLGPVRSVHTARQRERGGEDAPKGNRIEAEVELFVAVRHEEDLGPVRRPTAGDVGLGIVGQLPGLSPLGSDHVDIPIVSTATREGEVQPVGRENREIVFLRSAGQLLGHAARPVDAPQVSGVGENDGSIAHGDVSDEQAPRFVLARRFRIGGEDEGSDEQREPKRHGRSPRCRYTASMAEEVLATSVRFARGRVCWIRSVWWRGDRGVPWQRFSFPAGSSAGRSSPTPDARAR